MYQILQINDQLLEKYLKPLRKLLIICFICTFSFFLYSQNALPKEYIIEVIVFEQLKINDNEDLQPELLNISTLKSIGLSKKAEIIVNKNKIADSFEYENNSLILEPPYIEQINTYDNSPNENQSTKKINTSKWYEKIDNLNQLDNIYRRLDRRKEYKILHKSSWLQPALNEIDSPFVHEVFSNNGLLIKLYQSRYLHLNLITYLDGNLSINKNKQIIKEIKLNALQESIPQTVINKEILLSSELLQSDDIYITSNNLSKDEPKLLIKNDEVKYLLKEERRIFKNESHYFDHPKIGVIISVYDSSL